MPSEPKYPVYPCRLGCNRPTMRRCIITVMLRKSRSHNRGVGTIFFQPGPLCARAKFEAHNFFSVRGARVTIYGTRDQGRGVSRNCFLQNGTEIVRRRRIFSISTVFWAYFAPRSLSGLQNQPIKAPQAKNFWNLVQTSD